MKLPCEIVQDLLPLYEDDLCSPASRTAVEEHLWECSACRAQAENVRNFPEPELPTQVRDEDQAVARSFRKVRRRWVASLVAVLLVIPVLLLTVNQIRKQGICFTNVDEILAVGRYVRALERGDFEKAAACIDYQEMYQWIQELLAMEPEDHGKKAVAVTIGDEQWMATDDFYQRYLHNEDDPEDIWASLIYNGMPQVMIPEDIWNTVIAWESGSVTELADGEFMLNGEVYAPLNTPWGTYIAAQLSGLHECVTAMDFYAILELMPMEIYQAVQPELAAQTLEQHQYIQEHYGKVNDMTLEEFTDFVRSAYAKELKNCAEQGFSFASTGFEESYTADGESDWWIHYGMTLTNGQEECHISLQVRVTDGKLYIGAISNREEISGIDAAIEALFMTFPE